MGFVPSSIMPAYTLQEFKFKKLILIIANHCNQFIFLFFLSLINYLKKVQYSYVWQGTDSGMGRFFSEGLEWWVGEVSMKYYMKKDYKSAKERI